MGTGKTRTMIEMLKDLYREFEGIPRTLIFCPPVVIQNWVNELAKYSDIPAKFIIPLIGPGAKRAMLYEKGGPIFITNYESLLMPALWGKFLRQPPTILVLDESHKCKEIKAKRTKKAIKLGDMVHHKYLMTGTPVLNSPMDLFSQFRIMDGGKAFGKNFYIFRATYFYDANAGMPKQRYFPNWQIKPGSLEAISKIILDNGDRILKKDCLDLPPLVRKTLYVELSPVQARLYKEMKTQLVTYLNDKACVAQLALTKALRLMQITTGFLGTEGGEIAIKDNPRAKALADLLADLCGTSKVIVWCVFRENYKTVRQVCADLDLPIAEVHGGVKDKNAAISRFNDDPSVRVLLGHPGSGGIGVNLTVADYAIFYSRTFSLEYDLQAEARNHRGGSEIHQKITRIDLVAKGTIDEAIAVALANKIKIGHTILADII